MGGRDANMCVKRISIYLKFIASMGKALNERSMLGIGSFTTPKKMTNRSKLSNMCAIKWSKMTNKSHGTSKTSSMIHNIHAHGLEVLKREGYHLESMSLCVLHNAEVVGKVV